MISGRRRRRVLVLDGRGACWSSNAAGRESGHTRLVASNPRQKAAETVPLLVRLPARLHAQLKKRSETAHRRGAPVSMNAEVIRALETYLDVPKRNFHFDDDLTALARGLEAIEKQADTLVKDSRTAAKTARRLGSWRGRADL